MRKHMKAAREHMTAAPAPCIYVASAIDNIAKRILKIARPPTAGEGHIVSHIHSETFMTFHTANMKATSGRPTR